MKLEALRKGRANPRRYRNRRIGEFLKELKMTEGRGTGISKIKHALQDNGSPEAEFEFDEDHRYFQVRLPVHEAVKEEEGKRNQGISKDAGAQSGAQSRAQSFFILKALSSTSLSATELAKAIGLKSKTGSFKRTLKEMHSEGLVEYTIPDTPQSRLQKYRLTEKGNLLLAENKLQNNQPR